MRIEAILGAKGHTVYTVQPWTSVAAAVHRLVGPPQIGAVVVTGVAHGFTGLITERDVVGALRRHGSGALKLPVRELMAAHVPTCSPRDSVRDAMAKMTHTRHRHLPVLDRGELVGIVSIGDLVASRITDLSLETDVLRDLYLSARSQ
jgi:CBS domain-containing protein